MFFRNSHNLTFLLVLFLCCISITNAQTIGFDAFTTTSYYASPLQFTEDGVPLKLTATGGDAGYEFQSMSDYPAELKMGSDGGAQTVKITIEHQNGLTFDFESIDLMTLQGDAANWIIKGYNSGSQVSGSPVTFSLVRNNPYKTITTNFSQVDKITIEENPVNFLGFEIWSDQFVISNVLPVELISFTGSLMNNAITLTWETATEINNYGFKLERNIDNATWEQVTFIEGHGNSNSPKEYSFVDTDKLSGTVKYRLKQMDFDGSFEYSDIVEVEISSAKEFKLPQNYPNPFNPTTMVSYSLPTDSKVKIEITNMLGQSVKVLVNDNKSAGYYKTTWNAESLPSGIYFINITANGINSTQIHTS